MTRPHSKYALKRCEQGFTLAEVMIVIVLMGIVFTIASSSWLGIVESRRIDSATNQLASDLRLAHTSATNQLATWRVVLVPDQGEEADGADYYLVKLDTSGAVIGGSKKERTLPDDVYIESSAALNDSSAVNALYAVLFGAGNPLEPTRTLEFKADGSMDSLASGVGSDTVEVTQDGDPEGRITFIEATSRIKIE